MPDIADDELVADVDEPPDHRHTQQQSDFQKSTIRTQLQRKESLLTRALKTPEPEVLKKPDVHITTELSRRRSMNSNASSASTAELTSDGGQTSPSRTNTPSPPLPTETFTSFAPFSLVAKSMLPVLPGTNNTNREPMVADDISTSPKTQSPADVAPKKRCITFACGARREPVPKPDAPTAPESTATVAPTTEAPKRPSTIKFACIGPKPSEKTTDPEPPKTPKTSKPLETTRKSHSRSPSTTRKSPRPSLLSSRSHRDSTSTIRRASQSPVAVRVKPKYIIADEKTLQSSEATRFHEFASEELEEDDWIRRESDNPGKRLTINDTLKMENDIRRLGNEAEEEALEEDEEEEEIEEDHDGNDSDDENAFDEDEENEDSDDDASDGNETDNEAGFADSDESDVEGEFAFWAPGGDIRSRQSGEASTYRPSAHRSASASSIDSLARRVPTEEESQRPRRRRPIKIRPGTPDLPDSIDFVCGTLDEDRPLEDAYVSCMEARKNARRKQTPQDIDPSFPTSDVEDEEDEDDIVEQPHDSDEHVWLHGKFEDSDEERHGRRRSTTSRRKSPGKSPKRLRSPPPPRRLQSPPSARTRLRSPPPRKLFGNSPKRIRSPPPARMMRSPHEASPTAHASIGFAPLGPRPGLTHTKSLPRTPNAFCRQYKASRIIAANGNAGDDATDGHVRGAIDIVKGLEQKRQRRKEKFYQKQNNRKGKCQTERKPLPGRGAERMRELGLLMAGKTGANDPYMLSA
ncbi:hypothetical protein M430DRAFT_51199 [Amorphotheca resinae ATCC 22711]|uniref:Extensin domain-containing protein n=1 Tax=Amorphotheca resinae ATCC 22711 TaxID=857342 RepID=A0A2T3B0D0_AMORE|nr:hypothetical protein M430DRAFT_51199 [Amorphotheca resinae ATCC 22711]PSS16865.1 hypothetical protein M430DRAFT_51199 [Amorphotheca resinae ATCC 22711]